MNGVSHADRPRCDTASVGVLTRLPAAACGSARRNSQLCTGRRKPQADIDARGAACRGRARQSRGAAVLSRLIGPALASTGLVRDTLAAHSCSSDSLPLPVASLGFEAVDSARSQLTRLPAIPVVHDRRMGTQLLPAPHMHRTQLTARPRPTGCPTEQSQQRRCRPRRPTLRSSDGRAEPASRAPLSCTCMSAAR